MSNAVLIEMDACLLQKKHLAKFACDSRKKGAILMARNCVDRSVGIRQKSTVSESEMDRMSAQVDPFIGVGGTFHRNSERNRT
ncbi:hypothetical protein PQQ73_03735 [Paraburkholderia strydomiana]|uniref:Uncharacterized protein n=1 Tax=Paraburkholderia strydomiana TaxID=1245417 RepID=A0ABW9E7Y5_9BURK